MTSLSRSTPLSRALLVPGAFFERDRRIEASYRAGWLLRVASAAVTIGMFFFLGQVFDAAAPGLTDVGGSYFAFVLIGIVAQEFLSQSIGQFGGSLRESQTTGTLELMLLGRSRLATLVVSSTLWLHASAALGAIAYLTLGALLGVDLSRVNVPATAAGIVLMLVGFTGMGLLAGAAVLLIKRGNPVGWALRGASVLLGGILYPVSVLPPVLQALGATLPMTHVLVVLRGAMLEGAGVADLVVPLVSLALTSVGFLLVGLLAFAAAIRHGRIDGSLAQY